MFHVSLLRSTTRSLCRWAVRSAARRPTVHACNNGRRYGLQRVPVGARGRVNPNRRCTGCHCLVMFALFYCAQCCGDVVNGIRKRRERALVCANTTLRFPSIAKMLIAYFKTACSCVLLCQQHRNTHSNIVTNPHPSPFPHKCLHTHRRHMVPPPPPHDLQRAGAGHTPRRNKQRDR